MAKEQTQGQPDATTRHDETLRCAACEHRITEHAYRTERGGAHEHTFVNPAGYAFRIGCFVAAPGCAHVGWIFRIAGEQFHGLILSALR